jgi:hypothetical protein
MTKQPNQSTEAYFAEVASLMRPADDTINLDDLVQIPTGLVHKDNIELIAGIWETGVIAQLEEDTYTAQLCNQIIDIGD